MEEEDDDFYAPSEPVIPTSSTYPAPSAFATGSGATATKEDDELEEGEEEEEEEEEVESDSDIDIITDRKDGSKPEPPPQKSRYSTIRNLPARAAASDVGTKPPVKAETPTKDTKVVEHHPAVATSTLNINDKPTYSPAGKPITEVNIDTDLAEHEKPWRRPGSDVTDYFNYGFDEFTWTAYCEKQTALREEFDPKKMMEQMAMMTQQFGMALPGMPTGPTGPGAGAGGQTGMSGPGGNAMMNMPPMPGMGDIPPEMQAMMTQFMAQGGDINQLDPAMFSAMSQQGAGQGGGGGVQGQGFGGGQQGYGQAQGQGQQAIPGYGYDPSIMGDGGRNRGNFGGRGRGGRRNW
ncbi:hypothetical protein FGG08_000146 [Glutinoglossum americanum]|uniref:Pre-mRNA polyadenylation factor Fip1 domain-containing protein n=1 Tax=Glutinoglossum americanum TaxID=1670608 RepID=A0A9P8IDV6_9PEZI|nr:hypothetical protein FGG08_000146 [Glutinoglossum americanum]